MTTIHVLDIDSISITLSSLNHPLINTLSPLYAINNSSLAINRVIEFGHVPFSSCVIILTIMHCMPCRQRGENANGILRKMWIYSNYYDINVRIKYWSRSSRSHSKTETESWPFIYSQSPSEVEETAGRSTRQ